MLWIEAVAVHLLDLLLDLGNDRDFLLMLFFLVEIEHQSVINREICLI